MPEQIRDQVFISYSHKDKKWMERLQTALMPLVRQGAIRVWADTQINAGARRKDEIEAALHSTKVAVLLVSRNFLASELIAERELPQLLQSAEQNGATIVWVAVSASLYEETEIGTYEPANDPSHPLDSLRSADLNRELVSIARKIKAAASAPAPSRRGRDPYFRGARTHSGEPHLGRLVPKSCDRIPQETEFREFLRDNQRLRSGIPQVCFIHGKERECHESLVERLTHTEIKQFAEKKWGEQRGHVAPKQLRWVYQGEAADPQKELSRILFEQFEYPCMRDDFSPAELVSLAARSLSPVIVIQHSIHAGNWTRLTRELIEWYLSFWDTVGTNTAAPQFVVFLSVIYPRAAPGPRWKSWLQSRRLVVRRIEDDLREVASKSMMNCSSILLSELTSIEPRQVKDWFSMHNIYTEKIRYDLINKMFRTESGRIAGSKCMADIEHELEGIFDEVQKETLRARGYYEGAK